MSEPYDGRFDYKFKHQRVIEHDELEERVAVRRFLKIICGPMFAGKTTILFRHLDANAKAGRKVILVKYAKDTRYSESMAVSHDGEKHTSCPCMTLSEIEDILEHYEVIGIDEASFFPDLYEVVMRLLLKKKRIFIALLDAAFTGELWPVNVEPGTKTWVHLIPQSAVLTRITSTCSFCGIESAEATLKIIYKDNILSTSTEIEEIGGDEKYTSACSVCWEKRTNGTGLIVKQKKPEIVKVDEAKPETE